MNDLQGLEWAQTMDLVIFIGVVLVTIILAIFAFFYLRANRDFDLSFKSLGSQEDLAQINREILAKKDELERLNKQESILSDKINDLQAKQATVDQVTSQLNSLGMEYSTKSEQLAQLEQQLVKSQALQEFLNKHKDDQISELDRLIKEKEERLTELSSQVNELNGTKALGDALETAFADIKEQLDQSLDEVGQELTSISEIQASKEKLQGDVDALNAQIDELAAQKQDKASELEELTAELEQSRVEEQVGKSLGEVFDNLTDNLKDQVTQGLEAMGDQLSQLQQVNSAKDKLEQAKEQLEQEIEDLRDQLDSLEQQSKDKTKELEDLDKKVSDQKVEEQVGQSLNDAFERLSDSINSSMIGLGSDLSEVMELSAKRQELADENRRLSEANQKLLQENNKLSGKDAQVDDEAYKELEHEPDSITKFLAKFNQSPTTTLKEADALALFQRFLAANKLSYSDRVINAFHTALKIQHINPLSVLAGVSGTGKTQLALQYAKFFGFYSEHVAVQPRWDSKDDLLGFYNFLEKKFQPTDLVRALFSFDQYRINKNDPKQISPDSPMMMAILDEMNLARVEYYFSEFLSKLELRGSDFDKSKIMIGSNLNPRSFFVGHNVVIVGTMNDDESTYALSDKVLDRANVQHFGKPAAFDDDKPQEKAPDTITVDYELFSKWRQNDNLVHLDNGDREEIHQKIEELNTALDGVGKPFGHRVNNAIKSYLNAYPVTQEDLLTSVKHALADQVEMKIIPKLAGLEQNDQSGACLNRLKKVIDYTEDADLSAAFSHACSHYEREGMFLWRGVTRALED